MTTNPYVGPRSFETGEKLYGRDRELRTLSALLIAERIVLLHSPSGAGKTSLLRAGLLPHLREENFSILPIIRVNIDPPADVSANRYVLSTLLSLEEGFPVEERLPLADLAALSLDDYLNQRATDENTLLVFDQFEEILTISAADRDGKLAFFTQLGSALRNKTRWALFSMREDYLGAMALYARPIPNRLATRFRLDLLGVDSAIQAVQKPAKSAGVDFTTPAAQKLVDDLRRVQVQLPDGTLETQLGLYIEPVQLQVVCFRLWEGKDAGDMDIDEHDLASVGDVNQSLAEYYALSVAKVAQASGAAERSIREWFDRKLITPDGIRGQVRMGAELSEGLPNPAVRKLEDAHIIRAEQRAGQTWYELSHDRLIEPVREDNRKWFSIHLSLFQQQAVLWSQQGKSDGLLLRNKELATAEAESKSLNLTADEQAFLDACRALRAREQRDRRQRQFIIAGLVASLVLLVVAIFFGISANAATADAKDKAATAESAKKTAEAAKADADSAKSTAVANEKDAQQQKSNAEAASRRAFSGQLALASKNVVELFPQRAQLLALEALKVNLDAGEPVTSIAEEALRAANAQVNGRGLPGFSREVSFLQFTRDNQWLMAGSSYSGEFHAWKINEMDNPGYIPFMTTFTPPDTMTAEAYFSDQQVWFAIDSGSETRLWPVSELKAGAEPVILEGSAVILADEYSVLERKPGQVVLWRFDPQNLPEKTSFILEGEYTDISPDFTTVFTTSPEKGVLAWDTAKTPPESRPFENEPTSTGLPDSPEIESSSTSGRDDPWEFISRKGFEDESVISATSPDLQWHAEGAYGGSLRLWNLEQEQKFRVDSKGFLEVSSDGRWMVSGSSLWQLQDGRPAGLPIVFSQVDVYDAVFSPDGRWLLYVAGDIQLLDLSQASATLAGTPLNIDLSDLPSGLLYFSPGSQWLVTGGGQITGLWDLANPQAAPILLPEEYLLDVIFTPGDKHVVGIKTSYGPTDVQPNFPPPGTDIWIWQVSNQTRQVTEVGELQLDYPSILSQDGNWLLAQIGLPRARGLSWRTNQNVDLWDLRCIIQNTPCEPFEMEIPPVANTNFDGAALAFSPDSRYLISSALNDASRLNSFHIWNLQDASGADQVAPKLVYDAAAKYITALPVWEITQPITRRIYLFGGGGGGGGGEPGSYKIDYGIEIVAPNNAETSLQSLILRGHEEPVDRYQTSPSGRWTVTISADGLKLWDMAALQADPFAAAVNLPVDSEAVNSYRFTMDERWLVLVIYDNGEERLEFLPLWLDDMLAYACQSVGRNLIINEWQRYFLSAPYQKTCENLPEHQSVQIALQPTPTSLPTAATAPDAGSTSDEQPSTTPTLQPGSVQVTYIVKAGDNLYSIAKLLGTDLQTLMDENNITNPDLISIGQVIVHNQPATPTPTLRPRPTATP